VKCVGAISKKERKLCRKCKGTDVSSWVLRDNPFK
jgi:hypothetical protein